MKSASTWADWLQIAVMALVAWGVFSRPATTPQPQPKPPVIVPTPAPAPTPLPKLPSNIPGA